MDVGPSDTASSGVSRLAFVWMERIESGFFIKSPFGSIWSVDEELGQQVSPNLGLGPRGRGANI